MVCVGRSKSRPGRRGSRSSPGLVEKILEDVGDRAGTLPLLQHVLAEIWRKRRAGQLTLEAYVEGGGVQGALASTPMRSTSRFQRTSAVSSNESCFGSSSPVTERRTPAAESRRVSCSLLPDEPAAVEGLVRQAVGRTPADDELG